MLHVKNWNISKKILKNAEKSCDPGHIRMVKPSQAKLEIFAKHASEKIASLQKFWKCRNAEKSFDSWWSYHPLLGPAILVFKCEYHCRPVAWLDGGWRLHPVRLYRHVQLLRPKVVVGKLLCYISRHVGWTILWGRHPIYTYTSPFDASIRLLWKPVWYRGEHRLVVEVWPAGPWSGLSCLLPFCWPLIDGLWMGQVAGGSCSWTRQWLRSDCWVPH